MREDNNDNKMKSMVDKGWGDMVGRLDKDLPLPVASRNREKWLLLLLLFIIVMSAAYFSFLSNVDQDKPVKPIEEKAMSKEYFAKQGQINISTEELNSDEAGSKLKIQNSEPRIQNQKAKYPSIARASEGVANTKYITPVFKSIANAGDGIEGAQNENKSELSESVSDLNRVEGRRGSNNIVDYSINKLDKRLSFLDQKYGIPEIHMAIVNLREMNNVPLCRNSFEIAGGLISENIISFGGYEIAAFYNYRFNRNLSVQSGLMMSGFYKDGFSNSPALTSQLDNGFGPSTTIDRENWAELRYKYDVENSEIVNNEVGVEYITGIVDKLYYLNIPINLGYNINNYKIYAGVNFSGLLKATNKIKDYNDKYFNTVVLSDNVLENRNYFKRIDLGLNVGAETRISKRTYLYARFNYGLRHIISANSAEDTNDKFIDRYQSSISDPYPQRVDYNRYVSVGVKYKFEPCK